MKERKSYIIAIDCIGIALLLMLLCSCASFNICDWPSSFAYPHNNPPANWCGSMGAFCAYYILYYLGPGAFVILLTGVCFLVAKLGGITVGQPILRSIGLGLLIIAVSTTFYFFWPHRIYNFPRGSGGTLGITVVYFLKSYFALLGTAILLAATWTVGTILLADSFMVAILSWTGVLIKKVFGIAAPAWSAAKQHSEVLGEIWRKLSIKQKPAEKSAPAFGSGLSAENDLELEESVERQPDGEDSADDEPAQKPEFKPAAIPITHTQQPIVKPVKPYIPASYKDYTLPPLSLLAEPEYSFSSVQEKVVKSKAAALEKLLSEFNVNARVVEADTGPVVTMFELELAAGVKVSQISSLSNDIARALSAGAIRVVAPLPGKHTIGIEVPNSEKEKVRVKDLLKLAGDRFTRMEVPLFLGKDSSGEALVSDLTAMPHLLIAGTTGSGKSVCINSIIVSILLTKRPDEVKMILVDPKMVEMTAFNTVPHLMCPIVTETDRAVQTLEWATVKMDERYALLAEARVKNIAEYNKLTNEEIVERFNPSTQDEEAKIPKKLPYIIVIIDELADLMMTAPKEIEAYIVRLAQKSRAVGIHIVLATQRPQATVVTGLIKSNMPTRVAFRVAARMDSRIILDQNGAETLLGQGDMLFLKPGSCDLIRAQGTFIDDAEVRRIVKHLKEVAEPQFHPELMQLGHIDMSEVGRDELFDEAARVILESKRGSVSLLQRRLSIGYARASRIIEMMAASGILGEYKGSQAREVTMTLKDYERLRSQMEADAANDLPQNIVDADPAEEVEEDESPAPSEPAYVSEGQKNYISTDTDNEEEED